MHISFILPASLLAAAVAARPAVTAADDVALVPRQAATVIFTPFPNDDCNDNGTEQTYTVTSGTCYNAPFNFTSYKEYADFDPSTTPCAMTIFPQPACQGEPVAGVTLTQIQQCVGNPSGGFSFDLNCGP